MPELNTWLLFAIAVTNFGTAVLWACMQWTVSKIATNVQIVETATNSMKDALVAATAKAAHAAGMTEATAVAETKAATLAEGVLQGKSHP